MSNTLSMKNLSTIISSIKTDILSTRNRVLSNANLELIGLYHRIGKIISDNSEYGNNFIETLSKSIKADYPDAKGFSPQNLSRMKRFYEEYPDLSILPMPLAKLPWSVLCLLIEKIKSVLLELGKGFSFVGNQYRISTEGKDYYLDLLFYHIELRCYVVVELKTVDFDPSFIGQLQFYVTAVDETLRKEKDNQTIGLLLCRNKDRKSVEWALKSVNVPLGVASYEISKYLPTEEEINELI